MFSRAPREIRFFFERNIVTYPRRATGIRRHGGRRLKRAPHTTHETSSFSVVFFLVNQKNKRMIGLPNAKAVGDRRGQRRRSGDRSAEEMFATTTRARVWRSSGADFVLFYFCCLLSAPMRGEMRCYVDDAVRLTFLFNIFGNDSMKPAWQAFFITYIMVSFQLN